MSYWSVPTRMEKKDPVNNVWSLVLAGFDGFHQSNCGEPHPGLTLTQPGLEEEEEEEKTTGNYYLYNQHLS